MRSLKICLFSILICCLPLTAQAENKKIVISCTEFEFIEIKQPPPGFPFSDLACGDKCFYLDFTMTDLSAQRINLEVNAYKHCTREIYIDEHLMREADPFPINNPYSQILSGSNAHPTLEGAMEEALSICPKAVIKVPETVRY